MSTSAEVDLGSYRSAFELLPVPAMIVHRSTTVVLAANRRASQLFADGPGSGPALVGTPLSDLVATSAGQLVDDLRIAADGGDLPLVRGGSDAGQERRMLCRVLRLPADGGAAARWLVTVDERARQLFHFRRISNQVDNADRAAAHQRELRRRLASEYETLERFAQAMAHDLKGPIRHISSLVPVIEERLGADLPADLERLLDLIRQSAERGQDLIDALLRHAGAVSGPLELATVDLDRAVDEVVRDLQWAFDGVEHRMFIERPLGAIAADPNLVRILLDNLVTNAVKYRDPSRALEIVITSGQPDARTLVEVIDNGRGFDAADLDAVLQPFKRLHADVVGHGIGLATCQKICERHGWLLEADGAIGSGARFRVVA